MTSLKIKNKNQNCKKLLSLFVVCIAVACACFIATTFVSPNVGYADNNSPSGEVPSSLNFTPSGKTETNVPFTFWQKIELTNGGEDAVEDTYSYLFYPVDEDGNKLDIEQPFPDPADPENPESMPIDAKEFAFTMTGSQTKTFYINFKYVDLLFKYFDEPFHVKGEGWNFRYRSQMIKPEPVKENYSYDDTTFDVRIWVPENIVSAQSDLQVFCFNPIGEKVYDPGWTIKYDAPTPPATVTPKTIDPNWVIAGVAAAIVAFCIALVILERKRSKKRIAEAVAAATKIQ